MLLLWLLAALQVTNSKIMCWEKGELAAVFQKVEEAGCWGECCTKSQAPAAVPCHRDKPFLSYPAWGEGFSCKKLGNDYITHWYKHIFSSWMQTLLLLIKPNLPWEKCHEHSVWCILHWLSWNERAFGKVLLALGRGKAEKNMLR